MRPFPLATRACLAVVTVLTGSLTGCTGTSGSVTGQTSVAAPPPPPAPPAACLLDLDALTTGTGLAWAPDPATASDTRCVYDPAGGGGFLAVEISARTGVAPSAEVGAVAQVCADTPRPVAAGEAAMVCTLASGGVYAALADGGRLVTVAASDVPPGTTAQRLTDALAVQVGRLDGT